MGGKITNNTNEYLFIYATPKIINEEYDNSMFCLKPGESSKDELEVDGFFVPADRSLKQFSGDISRGPYAVKFRDFQHPVITQEGAIYVIDTYNWGVFKPSEWCRPSRWPTCVNWYIPNEVYSERFNKCNVNN